MDRFVDNMKKVRSFSDSEKAGYFEEKKKHCICPKCPSYTLCSKKNREGLYGIFGRSPNCITEEKGCICMNCPVYSELGFTKTYYCTRGSETEQRKKS